MITEIPGPSAFITDDLELSERVIVISQDRVLRDANLEWIAEGAVYFIPFISGQYREPIRFRLLNRDPFPFHPIQGAMVQKAGRTHIYLVNRVFRNSFVLESFEMKGTDLLYTGRIRSRLFVNPVRIRAVDNGELLLLNRLEPDWFGWNAMTVSRDLPNLVRIRDGNAYGEMYGLTGLDDFKLESDNRIVFYSIAKEATLIYQGRDHYQVRNQEPPVEKEPLTRGLVNDEGNPPVFRNYNPVQLFDSGNGEVQQLKMTLSIGDPEMKEFEFQDNGEMLNGPGMVFVKKNKLLLGQYYGKGILHCDLPES